MLETIVMVMLLSSIVIFTISAILETDQMKKLNHNISAIKLILILGIIIFS